MGVYACLKQIPDVEGIPSFDPESGFLHADAWYLNPLDAYAMRGALQTAALLRTDCVAVSFGGPESEEGLRHALGLGADRAILATSPVPMPGPGLTAWSLAGAIRADSRENGVPPAVVFCGRQASDVAGLQVPYRLAECLGFAVVGDIASWTVKDGRLEVLRQTGKVRERLETDMPCVFALNRGQGEMPRPTLPGLIRARKKTVRALAPETIAAAQPPEWSAPPADPVLSRTRSIPDKHHCRFAQGETVAERVSDLVRMLRENGSLP